MKKISLIFCLYFLFLPRADSHVSHYSELEFLKYDLYFNNKLIGNHTYRFENTNGLIKVLSKGSFKITKLGIDLMKYKTQSSAIYKDNKMINFNSETLQNDKKKYVKIVYNAIKKNYSINGSSFNGDTDANSIIGSLWNHEILLKKRQISSISGSVNSHKVNFKGKKKIKLNNKSYSTLNFQIISDDSKPLNEKKININIWYQENTLIWLKASYEKLGIWEYKLREAKYR